MSPFDRLKTAIDRQPELPDDLVAELLRIANRVGDYAGEEALLAELARQVEDYDPYAGVGCFGDACSAATIQATLRRLVQRT